MFGSATNTEPIKAQIKDSAGSSGVCGKTLGTNDVAWKCEDCEKDPTCIICQECFEKSDHKGHRVWLKRNVGGMCDCGDPDAWDPEHFCSDHKGRSEVDAEAVLASLPPTVRRNAPLVLNTLTCHLKILALELQKENLLQPV